MIMKHQACITLSVSVVPSARVAQLCGLFDVPPTQRSERSWDVALPLAARPWAIGLIVGPIIVHSMNTRIDPREMAIALCFRSACWMKMAAVLSDAHGVFAWGWNHAGPDGLGMHAEEHALHRANRQRLRGATIYVAGLCPGAQKSRRRRFVVSAPCEARCLPLLRATGIQSVQFVRADGSWASFRLRPLTG